MKIVVYSSNKKELKKLLYNISLLKSLKEETYVFINNFEDVEILRKLKEKIGVNFIVSKKKISKIKALKIIRDKLKDDILFIEGSINFNLKKLKNITLNKKIVVFGYKSRILRIFNLNYLGRLIFISKNLNIEELLKLLEETSEIDIDLEYFFEKQVLIDILNNIKRVIKSSIRFINKLLERKIIRDLINEKIGFISLKFFTFLLLIILARFLTIELYGRYVNFHNLVSSLATVVSLSIPVYKFFSEKKEERQIYLINSLSLYFINSFIIFLILLIFRDFFLTIFNTKNLLIFPLIIITSLLFVIRSLLSQLFFSDLKFEINKYFDIFEGLFKLIFVLIFSIISPTKGAILGIFFTFFILDIIEILFIKKYYPELVKKIKIKVDLKKIKELLKYGISINFANILISFYTSFRFNLISYIKGLVELSLYFNAFNVVYILANLLSIYNITLPRIVNWSEVEIRKKAKYLFIIQFLIYILLALILVIFSDKIILILFGERYLEASIYLKYSTVILPILSAGIFYNILWLKSRLKEVSIINLVYLVSFVLLDVLLILKFGIFGAIASNIISTFIQYSLSFIFFKMKI